MAALSQRKHKDLVHYVPMNFRRCAGLLLSLNLLLVGAPTALAHEFPSPTPAPGVAPLSEQEQYKLALEHYKLDMEKYRVDKNQWELVRREINKAFFTAIKAVNSITSKTLDVDNRKKNTVIDAVLLRDQALAALGGAPVEPTKPVKPIASATTKKTKKSNPSPTPSP